MKKAIDMIGACVVVLLYFALSIAFVWVMVNLIVYLTKGG